MQATKTFSEPTDHMVDDLIPQDEAMDRLRQRLPLITYKVRVSDNGKLMTFHNGNGLFSPRIVAVIQQAIDMDSLPLRVEHNTPRHFFKPEDFIHVIYTGK